MDASDLTPAGTPAEIASILENSYPEAGWWSRILIRWRPFICPFEEMLPMIPAEWAIMDIGCGIGLVCVLLAQTRRAKRVIGVDTSRAAVEAARHAVIPSGTLASFICVGPEEDWPREQVDGVVCVDVLHHVPRGEQREFIRKLVLLNWTGKLFFKDVSPRPAWKAIANRLHDLVVARETISIRDEDEVRRWFQEEGLTVSETRRLDVLWYSHYFFTAERA